MKDFNHLINRSYHAIKRRGLIKDSTTDNEFISKMSEELSEIKYAHKLKFKQGVIAETVDLMNVCICALKHNGYDPIAELEKCVIHNETRKD